MKHHTSVSIGRCIRIILIVTFVIPAASAGGAALDRPGPDAAIPTGNWSGLNETALSPYYAPAEPVTVFHADVNTTSLPGPRYMAFGPSAIDLSLPPVVFSILVVLAAIICATWSIHVIGKQ